MKIGIYLRKGRPLRLDLRRIEDIDGLFEGIEIGIPLDAEGGKEDEVHKSALQEEPKQRGLLGNDRKRKRRAMTNRARMKRGGVLEQ